jgi:hypothetical protein
MISRVLDAGNGMGIRFPTPLQPKAFEVLMDFAVASGMVTNSAADLARGRKPQADSSEPQTEGPTEIPEPLLRDRRIRDQDAEQVKEQLRRIATRGVTAFRNCSSRSAIEICCSRRAMRHECGPDDVFRGARSAREACAIRSVRNSAAR